MFRCSFHGHCLETNVVSEPFASNSSFSGFERKYATVCYLPHKRPPLITILNRVIKFTSSHALSLRCILILYSYLHLCILQSSGYRNEIFYAFFFYPTLATCTTNLILLNPNYEPSALRNFLHVSLLPTLWTCSQIPSVYILPKTWQTKFRSNLKQQLLYDI
jgi:hypothetical protein